MERTITAKQLEQVIRLADQKKHADEQQQPIRDKIEALKDLEETCSERVLYDKIGPAVDIEKNYLQAALNEVAPSAERVVAYCKENGYGLTPNAKYTIILRATKDLFSEHIISDFFGLSGNQIIRIEQETYEKRYLLKRTKCVRVLWCSYDFQQSALTINCVMQHAPQFGPRIDELLRIAKILSINANKNIQLE